MLDNCAGRACAALALGVLCLVPGVWAARGVVDFGSVFGEGATNEFVNDRAFDFGPVGLNNSFDAEWGSWAGFAMSRVDRPEEGRFANQYGAAASWDGDGYAVAYADGWNPAPTVSFAIPAAPASVWVDNTAYAAAVLEAGNGFARAFTNGDYFVLRLVGLDAEGAVCGTVEHALADFREGRAFIQREWTEVGLEGLGGGVSAIRVELETTDVGAWGANTPMYVALADLAFGYSGAEEGVGAADGRIAMWASEVVAYAPGPGVSNQFAAASNALGAAQAGVTGGGAVSGVVSLGDNGSITLGFPRPIRDGPGADFVVFENAFSEEFLELAYVEVSDDGARWARFPSHSLETNRLDEYGLAACSDATAYGGLAGKTVQGTGVAFDLALLRGNAEGVDVDGIRYVRIVDICGDGSCLDSYGNPIFDPYPTHGSPGFDLDAVGALNVDVRIGLDGAEAPELPGFARVLEWTDDLCAADGWRAVERMDCAGFYRYRFEREAE